MRTPVLVTIPFSHFCEKARWALDACGVEHREETHAPGFHFLGTRPRGGKSVPILVTGEGVLTDSTDIVAWASARAAGALHPLDVNEEVRALEDEFDRVLGPEARRWFYSEVLPRTPLAVRIMQKGVPRWERALVPLVLPALRAAMLRAMRIDAITGRRALDAVRKVFDRVATRLADGRRYLTGDRFTAADLTFAALSGPLVLAREAAARLPPESELPEAILTEIRSFEAHPAGAFVLRLYSDHRLKHVRPETEISPSANV